MKRITLLALSMLAFVTGTQAGGFQIAEMATRATGMANAFTAVADDASAAWHNPAGVAYIEGKQVMVGGDVIIVPSVDFTSNTANPLHPVTTSSEDKTFFVPHAYFTYNDGNSPLSYSLGVNSPFGLESEWPSTGPFASKNTLSRIQMIHINPNVSYRISDNMAVAAGFEYAYVNQVDFNNSLQTLEGDGDGWGGNVALMYRRDAFKFGVSYRSRIKVDVDGTASAVPGSVLFGAGTLFGATSTAASTSVTLPDQVNVGLAWMANERLLLSLDVDWVNWTTFDSIDIQFANAAYLAAFNAVRAGAGATSSVSQAVTPSNWDSTVAFRLGAEWKYRPDMRARFGYAYDPTPIEDVDFSPGIPGNDRHLFSLGYGHDFNSNITVDIAYMYVLFEDRDQTLSPTGDLPLAPNTVKNGAYESDVHIVATSLVYKF